MSAFSVNQTTQLYVVTSSNTATAKKTSDGKSFYITYEGVGGKTRTDLIPADQILDIKQTDNSYTEKGQAYTINLNGDINSGAPISGQDYIIRMIFGNYEGISDEQVYIKEAMVHAYAGMNAATFYQKLAVSILLNFKREAFKLVQVLLGNKEAVEVKTINGVLTPVDASGAAVAGAAITIKTIFDTSVYRRGIRKVLAPTLTVTAAPVLFEGGEVAGLTIAKSTSVNTLTNGYKFADMEWFFLGERGDQYRNAMWPHNNDVEYLVDPTKKYHSLAIHYAYIGANESVQKSEKDIILIAETAAPLTAIKGVLQPEASATQG